MTEWHDMAKITIYSENFLPRVCFFCQTDYFCHIPKNNIKKHFSSTPFFVFNEGDVCLLYVLTALDACSDGCCGICLLDRRTFAYKLMLWMMLILNVHRIRCRPMSKLFMLNGLWESRLFQQDGLWLEKRQFWGAFVMLWLLAVYWFEVKISPILPRKFAEKASAFRRNVTDLSPKWPRRFGEKPPSFRRNVCGFSLKNRLLFYFWKTY